MTFDPGKEFDELLEEITGGAKFHDFSGYEMERAWALGIQHGRKIIGAELRRKVELEDWYGTL